MMRESKKLILGGIWVLIITLISVWLLSLFQDTANYSIVVLVWAFAWLSGLHFSSFMAWSKEYREKKNLTLG